MRYPLRMFCGAFLAAGLVSAARVDSRLADAEKKSDKAEVRALLEQHLDVNATAVDGDTALHWAAYWDDLETARLLLDSGANVNTANRYGVTPLSLAATNGSAAMIDLLLATPIPTPPLPGGVNNFAYPLSLFFISKYRDRHSLRFFTTKFFLYFKANCRLLFHANLFVLK